jgi:multidrug transporter EmrE-like cation transporter
MSNLDFLVNKIKQFTDNSIVDEIIILAIIVAIIESFAQNTLKTSDHGSIKFMFGLFIYVLVGYVLHYAYHNVPLSKLNVTWSCFSIILAISIGYFLYDEEFDKYTIISLILAIGAIYFANKKMNKI